MRRKNIMAAIRHRKNLIAKALRLKIFAGKKMPSKKHYRRISDAGLRARVKNSDASLSE